jgi:hypothetical protein
MTVRTIRKRVAAWTAGVMLVLYVLGAPIIAFVSQRYVPSSVPVLMVVYYPLLCVSRDSEMPGHDLFRTYVRWCEDHLRRALP